MDNAAQQTTEHARYIEVISPDLKVGTITSALFDFDGTVSVIREGWQEVMCPMMVEILLDTPQAESEDELAAIVRDYVDYLTGKDTIYQMMRLAEEVTKRGGRALDPLDYKHEYLRRLMSRIQHRIAGLKAGEVAPRDMVIEGAIDFIEDLHSRGVTLYLASGTDHPYVVDEAAALGLAGYFGERIYGALDAYWTRSKALIIRDILEKNRLHGSSLVTFGDGFVEIENCKEVGGLAIGVASDEVKRRGVNAWKRDRLIRAGADAIIPDFTDRQAILNLLFPDGWKLT